MEFKSMPEFKIHTIMSVIIPLTRDYYDKGFVLNHLEDFILLPGRVKEAYRREDPMYEHDYNLEHAVFHHAVQTFETAEKELELRKTVFNAIRTKFPNFCSSIQSSLTEEQYQEYLKLQKKILECFSQIQSLENLREYDKSYDEDLLERKDSISSLIDSESTSRLSALEDTYLLEQLNSINLKYFNQSMQNKINHIKGILNRRLKGYALFEKLYSTPKSEIRLDLYEKSKEREI